jgi:hypothetical protein
MVTTEIIMFSLVIGAICILAGLFAKQDKAIWLSLFGSLLFIVTGIVLLGSPLSFPTGSQTVVNATTYTTSIVYSTQNVGINTMISFIVLFVGMLGLYLAAVGLYELKYKEE